MRRGAEISGGGTAAGRVPPYGVGSRGGAGGGDGGSELKEIPGSPFKEDP